MTDKTDHPFQPAHRVCFREILVWANKVRTRRHPTSHPVPTSEEVKELMDTVTAAVRQDRATALAAVKAENAKLRAALVALDTLMGFSEPVKDKSPMIFVDPSGINKAMEQARAALSPQEGG